jgi:hypothetical protein
MQADYSIAGAKATYQCSFQHLKRPHLSHQPFPKGPVRAYLRCSSADPSNHTFLICPQRWGILQRLLCHSGLAQCYVARCPRTILRERCKCCYHQKGLRSCERRCRCSPRSHAQFRRVPERGRRLRAGPRGLVLGLCKLPEAEDDQGKD